MLKECIEQLMEREPLSAEQAFLGANEMLNEGEPAQIAAFLALLRAKGETAEELVGLVKSLRSQAKKLLLDRPMMDIVGTGGDQAGTVNISTGSALLAASLGIPVLKHGNRAVSSRCGSADVLEEMGFPILQTPEEIQKNIRERNFAFCFAPAYHPTLQKVRPIRNGLKIPTAFNLIGPLLNPAGLDYMQIGVFRPEMVRRVAEALFQLGTKRSLVFHGHGLDELSCIGPIEALLVTEKGIEEIVIDPKKLGLKSCTLEDLKGGDAKENAKLLKEALSGIPTRITDTLILNAGVALFLYGPARTIQEGVDIAKEKLLGKKKSLKQALLYTPHAVIAEIKRKSPSKGEIGKISDPAARASLYVQGGAAAISVLTSAGFGGNLADLKEVANALQATPVPVIRKDFLLTKEDIQASQDADAVLLIVSKLGARTEEMLLECLKVGLEAIVEVHTEEELKIAIDAGAEIIGVNQRDLNDFSMHPEVYERLIGKIPANAVKIAESGMRTEEDVRFVRQLGYDAVLVGETLTRSQNPLETLSTFRQTYVR